MPAARGEEDQQGKDPTTEEHARVHGANRIPDVQWGTHMADSLRTVIGTTLAIGGLLTGILLLRESRFAPEWLRPPSTEAPSSAPLGGGVPALPPAPPPPPAPTPPPATTAAAPSTAAPVASAAPEPSVSAPAPVASATASARPRRQGAQAGAQPGDPEVVELPADFQYSPKGAGNLTFPVAPATASTATGQPR